MRRRVALYDAGFLTKDSTVRRPSVVISSLRPNAGRKSARADRALRGSSVPSAKAPASAAAALYTLCSPGRGTCTSMVPAGVSAVMSEPPPGDD